MNDHTAIVSTRSHELTSSVNTVTVSVLLRSQAVPYFSDGDVRVRVQTPNLIAIEVQYINYSNVCTQCLLSNSQWVHYCTYQKLLTDPHAGCFVVTL